jgi:hypothetical protein
MTNPLQLDNAIEMLMDHAHYSFNPIKWDFEMLTDEEKRIIDNQSNFDALRTLCGADDKED